MYTLGIDIGSTSSKAVILENGNSIVARSLYALGQVVRRVLSMIYSKRRIFPGTISLTASLPVMDDSALIRQMRKLVSFLVMR